jgi:type IV pilus assembly protein PilA
MDSLSVYSYLFLMESCFMKKSSAKKKYTDAFTLLEIMIVVAIIGLLAIMAIPAFQKARFNSRVANFVNDIRIAVDAFGIYSLDQGTYPPDKTPSIIPPGMAEYLQGMNWTGRTPIGGRWDWDYNAVGIKAGVTAIGTDISTLYVKEIDRRLDDGNLSTGHFRRTGAGGYSYVIED